MKSCIFVCWLSSHLSDGIMGCWSISLCLMSSSVRSLNRRCFCVYPSLTIVSRERGVRWVLPYSEFALAISADIPQETPTWNCAIPVAGNAFEPIPIGLFLHFDLHLVQTFLALSGIMSSDEAFRPAFWSIISTAEYRRRFVFASLICIPQDLLCGCCYYRAIRAR